MSKWVVSICPQRVLLLGVLVLICGFAPSDAAVDDTIVGGAKGADVVNQVIRDISRSGIFRDDRNLLRRLAYVETKFGTSAGAYPPNYHGGIWRLDEDKYEETKHSSLSAHHLLIQAYFATLGKYVAWNQTTWRDLRKPLFSSLATRLYLQRRFGDAVPPLIPLQAAWWATEYNVNPAWEANYFSRQVEELESDPTCDGLLDLVIVMDGSGSIGGRDFQLAKQFTANLVSTFSLETTRIGFIVYSSSVSTIFGLDNRMNQTELNRTILGVPYPAGGTNTGAGIMQAIQVFSNVTSRPGVPKLLAVFTDGHSNEGMPVDQAAAAAARANLTSFGIGIGSEIHEPELLIIANWVRDNVFLATSYDELAEFFKRFNQQVCDEPQEPGFDDIVEDSLKQGEKRYFKYEVPAQGLTVRLTEKVGGTEGYWSYSEPNPSSAFYDGVLEGEETFIPAGPPTSNSSTVHISVQGTEAHNEYSLEAVPGNQVSGAINTLAMPLVVGIQLIAVTLLKWTAI